MFVHLSLPWLVLVPISPQGHRGVFLASHRRGSALFEPNALEEKEESIYIVLAFDLM